MLGKAWKTYEVGRLVDLEGLLTEDELRLFAWLAESAYDGVGEIVDAGAFLGSSAACFAHGLARNAGVALTDGRIHSFDLFTFAPFFNADIVSLRGFERGQSFLHIFHRQLGDHAPQVTAYPGNILRRTWRGGPIELLMLDCCKTQQLNDHCMRQFLPSLIPGSGRLLQQDYAAASRLHWIHSAMYLLRDHFEFLGGVDHGGTMVFRCVRAIAPSDVEAVIEQQRSADILELAGEAAAYMRPRSQRCARVIQRTAQRFVDDPP